jgi:hypothetical protein
MAFSRLFLFASILRQRPPERVNLSKKQQMIPHGGFCLTTGSLDVLFRSREGTGRTPIACAVRNLEHG